MRSPRANISLCCYRGPTGSPAISCTRFATVARRSTGFMTSGPSWLKCRRLVPRRRRKRLRVSVKQPESWPHQFRDLILLNVVTRPRERNRGPQQEPVPRPREAFNGHRDSVDRAGDRRGVERVCDLPNGGGARHADRDLPAQFGDFVGFGGLLKYPRYLPRP